jgi:signal transduction histidine kinase
VVNPAAVECALDTVIDNALKFSPADRPVEVSLDSDGETATITVRDHGPGMPVEQLSSAAGRFWRAPEHRSVPGSGLGLSIASELLDGLGGGVTLDLPDGGGLSVRLRIPAGGAR